MTRVSAFLFFFTSTQSSQSRTPHSYTIMSQSITSMDAGTQTKPKTKRKDVPTYPEPEGCPSY